MDKFTFKGQLKADFKTDYKLTMENVDKSPAQAYTEWLEDRLFDVEKMAKNTNDMLDDAGIFK